MTDSICPEFPVLDAHKELFVGIRSQAHEHIFRTITQVTGNPTNRDLNDGKWLRCILPPASEISERILGRGPKHNEAGRRAAL